MNPTIKKRIHLATISANPQYLFQRWENNNKYIIYQLNGAVKTTEAKPETIKNDLTLARLEKIEKIVIDGKGENLYFAGKIGNQQGIFQLELQ